LEGNIETVSSSFAVEELRGLDLRYRNLEFRLVDRNVALKILPMEVASHRDRMERFVREAKCTKACSA
jgi:hypothetical protein